MLKIEVWKDRWFVGPKQLRGGLKMFVAHGDAFASWQMSFCLRQPPRINVSDPLATMVLGAVRDLCPFADSRPRYTLRFTSEDYTFRYGSSGEEGTILENCTQCGQFEVHLRSPIQGGSYLRHPKRICLQTPKDSAHFTEADWDVQKQTLTPPTSDGQLLIWIKSAWASPRERAIRTFPKADVIYDTKAYVVLRLPVNAEAAN